MTEDKKNNLNNEGILPAASRFSDQEKVVFAAPEPRISGYRIVRMLSEGGMGIIYLADQIEPVKRRVAIKVVKPGMDSKQVLARFKAEQQALALLDHPGIAQVYSAGTTETGRPYFVMEYVKGIALVNHCEHYRLSIEERLNLFIQVCDAIQHAHQKGIIHRDIKPSNILVTIENEKPILKIIDFGIAKAISTQLTEQTLYTQLGQMIGTPDYMSPEQAEITNQDIDIRSDIYSLGVVLYELLTGVLPFDSQKLREAPLGELQKIIEQTDPPRPSTRLSSLGEQAKEVARKRKTDITSLIKRLHKELEWIPLKAMRKERTHRYRTASEFADDIRNYLTGAPLIAGPESVSYQIRKFVNRNQMLVSSVAIILAIIVIGAFVSTIFGIREYRARVIADTERKRAIQAQQETQQANEQLSWENYVATLGVIQFNILNGQMPRAREQLYELPVRHRGWEWGRLFRQTKPELVNINNADFENRPPVTMHNAIFTPDERYILDDHPGGAQKTLTDLRTGETVLTTKGYGTWRECTQFMPDPNHVSFAFGRCAVGIVDLWSGKTLTKFDADKATLRSFIVSSDYKHVAGYAINEQTGEREIILWNASDAQEIRRFKMTNLGKSDLPLNPNTWGESLETPRGHVLGFLDDNKHIAYVDEHLSTLNIETGEKTHIIESRHWIGEYEPKCQKAIIINDSSKFEVWDVVNKTRICESERNVYWHALAISPDGKWIATPEQGAVWHLWSGITGKHIRSYGHDVGCISLDFSSSGALVATSILGEIKIWSVHSERIQETIPFKTTDGQATDLELLHWARGIHAHNNRVDRLVTDDGNGQLSMWNIPSFTLIKRWTGHNEAVLDAAFNPNDQLLATSSMDGTAKIWDTASGKLLHTITNKTEQTFKALAFSNDNQKLAIGSGRRTTDKWNNLDFEVSILNLNTEQIETTFSHSEIGISSLAYSPNGKLLVVGHGDYYRPGTVFIVDAETGKIPYGQIPDMWASIALVTSDSRYVLLRGDQLMLWDIQKQQEVWRFEHTNSHRISLHPDNKCFVSTANGDNINICAIKDGRELMTIAQGLPPAFFSSDGKDLIYRRKNQFGGSMIILHSDDWTYPDKKSALKAALDDIQQELDFSRFYQSDEISYSTESEYLNALKRFRFQLGEEHPYNIACMNRLARLYQQQGRYNLAEPLFVKILDVQRRVRGDDDHNTLKFMENLIEFYYNLDRPLQSDYTDKSRPADFGFIQTSLLKRIDKQKYQPVFNLAASLELERALKAKNPEFKDNVRCRVENGKVVDVDVSGAQVSNINALKGLPLKTLNISKTLVSDIGVLRQMPLKSLYLNGTKVSDISALVNLPLIFLDLSNTPIRNSNIGVLKNESLRYVVMPDAQLEPLDSQEDTKMAFLKYNSNNKPILLMNFDKDFIYQKESRRFVRNLCGNGNDGIMHGNILMDDKFGGLRLDGIDDSVIIPSFGNIAPTSEITIAMWIKLDEIRDQDLFSLDPFEPRPGSRITIHFPWGSDIHWQFGEPIEGISMTLPKGIIGAWEHYAFIASSSGSFMKIYRNGIEEVSITRANNFELASADAHIAGSRTENKFKGSIDDVAIYDRALTAKEIQNLYLIGLKAITGNNLSSKDPQHNVQQESVFSP